ncbi:MAG: hypothetical protein H6574_25695, partial [Lewinellaceae bacterium]|nr:hypothetical protein [Lewinellaceae bacterium]
MAWHNTIEAIDSLDKGIEVLHASGRKIGSLNFLKKFTRLKELYLHSFKVGTLDDLSELKNLEILALENVGNGANLGPLSKLQNLRELILQTPPGWDGSGKKIIYKSLKPLKELQKLERLTTFDVYFEEDGLQPLFRLPSLIEFNTKNSFTTQEFAKLAAHRPDITCVYAHPYKNWDGFEHMK